MLYSWKYEPFYDAIQSNLSLDNAIWRPHFVDINCGCKFSEYWVSTKYDNVMIGMTKINIHTMHLVLTASVNFVEAVVCSQRPQSGAKYFVSNQ